MYLHVTNLHILQVSSVFVCLCLFRTCVLSSANASSIRRASREIIEDGISRKEKVSSLPTKVWFLFFPPLYFHFKSVSSYSLTVQSIVVRSFHKLWLLQSFLSREVSRATEWMTDWRMKRILNRFVGRFSCLITTSICLIQRSAECLLMDLQVICLTNKVLQMSSLKVI